MSILQSIKQQMFRLCFYNIWYHNLFSFAGLINLIILPAGIYYYALPLIAPETLSLMMLCGIIKITIAVTPPFIIEALRALHNKISQFTRQCAKALWPFKQHTLVDPKNNATRPVPANEPKTKAKDTRTQSPTKPKNPLTNGISLTEASTLITTYTDFVRETEAHSKAKVKESHKLGSFFSLAPEKQFTFTFADKYGDIANDMIAKSIESIQQHIESFLQHVRQDINPKKEDKKTAIGEFFPEFKEMDSQFMGDLHTSYKNRKDGKPYDATIQTRFNDNRAMINARLFAYLYVLLDIPSAKNLNILIKISQNLVITGPREITSLEKHVDNKSNKNSKLPLIETLIMVLIQQQSEPKKLETKTIEQRLLTAIEAKNKGNMNGSYPSAPKVR